MDNKDIPKGSPYKKQDSNDKHIPLGIWLNEKNRRLYMITGTRIETTNNCCSAGKVKVDYQDEHDKYTQLKSEFLNKFKWICSPGELQDFNHIQQIIKELFKEGAVETDD